MHVRRDQRQNGEEGLHLRDNEFGYEFDQSALSVSMLLPWLIMVRLAEHFFSFSTEHLLSS